MLTPRAGCADGAETVLKLRSLQNKTPKGRRVDGTTVYYPFALVDLVDDRQTDEDGEVLLSFMDEDGCQVSIRLRRHLVDALKDRLGVPPAGCATRAETVGAASGVALGAAVGGGTLGTVGGGMVGYAAGRAYDQRHN